MTDDPVPAHLCARASHIDLSCGRRQEPPNACSGAVTEDRPGTGRQDGSHPPSLLGNPSDTDDIDPAVQLMEPPPLKPQIDRPASHAHREQLPPRHHPMLPLGQPRHRPVKKSSVQLTPYMRAN